MGPRPSLERPSADVDHLMADVFDRMRTFGSWAWTLLLSAALGTGCGGGPAQPTGTNGGRDAASGSDGAADVGLEVDTGEPLLNLTCTTARPLSDGQVLRKQDLSQGRTEADLCKPTGSSSLFYSATLYPDQYVEVQVNNVSGATPPLLRRWESCSDVSCRDLREPFGCTLLPDGACTSYLNGDSAPKTVVIEATFFGAAPPTFDMSVKMPLRQGGISVAAARGLTTGESGGQATFEVSVTSAVVDPVDIPIVSNDPAEGIASPATLRFTSDNWQKPQTVTVTGVDDGTKDGNRPYTVTVGPSTSHDRRYLDVEGHQVALVNRDDEPGFTFEGPAVLQTSESGARSTFRVVLNRAPSATVRLPLTSSDEGEGKVDPAELVFEPGNWNQAQTVTLTGIDDDERDGTGSYQVVTGPATSADPQYAAMDPPDLIARNSDNDFERVAAQVVSAGLYCNRLHDSWQQLAADRAANLYAVMSCQDSGSRPDGGSFPSGDAVRAPTVFAAVSLDGGRTFGTPVDTGLAAYQVAVAGGAPGVAVVAASGHTGMAVVRTEDAGVTWQPPVVLDSLSYGIRVLAVAGQRVLLSASTGVGDTWWLSEDGGRTFQSSRPAINGWPIALGLDPDGTIWIVNYDLNNPLFFRTSRDDGKTFQSGFHVPVEGWYSRFVASPNLLFTVRNELLLFSRDGSGTTQSVPGLTGDPSTTYYALLADESDNVVVLSGEYHNGSSTQVSTVEARRLSNGETQLSAPKLLGPSDQSPSAVALSENATAVLLTRSGQVSVAVETWP
jgi:hypothetical protein